MAEVKRDLKIHLTLTEREAGCIYVGLKNPPYHMKELYEIKEAIKRALGYTPQEAPDL